jgi:hypothetical protein
MLRFESSALLAFTLLTGDCVASSFCMLDPCFNEACYKTWRNDAAEKLYNCTITKVRNGKSLTHHSTLAFVEDLDLIASSATSAISTCSVQSARSTLSVSRRRPGAQRWVACSLAENSEFSINNK